MERVYFDHNATTPLAPEVLEAMVAAFGQTFGNASSIHHFGQAAKQRLEAARRQIAAAIHANPAEVVFTGGGTESDNLAILGVARGVSGRRHVITTAIEHTAVLSTCAQLEREGVEVTRLPVGAAGVVDPESLRRELRPETVLVSVMHANNELGTVQPIAEIAHITREAGVVLHVDGVQAFGKIPVDVKALGADLYTMSAHKLYGPKGVGALYVRKGTKLAPVVFGGHHERDRRPGTENVPAIVGFGVAAELASTNLAADSERIAGLRDRLETAVLDRIRETGINGAREERTPNTTNIYFDGIDGEALVIALDLRGFAVSTGSACSSGAVTPSHVLTAIGRSAERARASIRFSLGTSTTRQQVDALVEALEASVVHLRRISVHA
ncbi:MAG TPA: cysteine desulfurase family protein [Bryobacteraceae bacterium]|nr:cysteine desulfurase family protein [Bryobacteraceae bacterium]